MNDEIVLKNLGLKLKYERLKKGYTQERLAEKVEVHEKYISLLETGKQNVTLKTLNRIANVLEVEIYKFLMFD